MANFIVDSIAQSFGLRLTGAGVVFVLLEFVTLNLISERNRQLRY